MKNLLFTSGLLLGLRDQKRVPLGQEETIWWKLWISFFWGGVGMNTSQPWRLIRFQWLLVYYFQLSVLADAFLRRIRLSTKQPSSYSFPPCLWINHPAISTIITAKQNISEAIKVEDERTCRGKKTPCTLKTVESDGEHQWKNQETRLKRGIKYV